MEDEISGRGSREKKKATRHQRRNLGKQEQKVSCKKFKNHSPKHFPNPEHSKTKSVTGTHDASVTVTYHTDSRESSDGPVSRGVAGDTRKTSTLEPQIRSASESRGRFTTLFRRRKRSKSEADIPKDDIRHLDRPGSGGLTHDKIPTTAQAGKDELGFEPKPSRRSNLKRSSPHYSFDARLQPRARLRHMTIRDAVKEERLRRQSSLNRSPVKGDHTDPTWSPSVVRFTSTPSLFGHVSTFNDLTLEHPESAEVSQTGEMNNLVTAPPANVGSQAAELTNSSRDGKQESAGDRSTVGGDETDTRQHKSHRFFKPQTSEPSSHGSSRETQLNGQFSLGTNKKNVVKESYIPNENIGDPNLGDTGVTPISAVDLYQEQQAASIPTVEDAIKVKWKRVATLSKFLELRQTVPSRYSRPRPTRESSDSGVTSSDTSPQGSFIYNQARHKCQGLMQQGLPVPQGASIASNNLSHHPLVAINGDDIDLYSPESPSAASRPTYFTLDDSIGGSSSLSSSPQINSMSSSFRSSDQGYANTESEEEATFSTPPEDSVVKQDVSRPAISPLVLSTLLQSFQQSRNKLARQRENFSDTKWPSFVKDNENLMNRKGEYSSKKHEDLPEPRYVPRGVRRAKSDVCTRLQPPKRIPRNQLCLSKSPHSLTRASSGWARVFLNNPNLERGISVPDEDLLSASSTTTLTNQDGDGFVNGDHVGRERMEVKMVPVMGTLAQQRYRRTFSPSRVKLAQSPTETSPVTTAAVGLNGSVTETLASAISPYSSIPEDMTSKLQSKEGPQPHHVKNLHFRRAPNVPHEAEILSSNLKEEDIKASRNLSLQTQQIESSSPQTQEIIDHISAGPSTTVDKSSIYLVTSSSPVDRQHSSVTSHQPLTPFINISTFQRHSSLDQTSIPENNSNNHQLNCTQMSFNVAPSLPKETNKQAQFSEKSTNENSQEHSKVGVKGNDFNGHRKYKKKSLDKMSVDKKGNENRDKRQAVSEPKRRHENVKTVDKTTQSYLRDSERMKVKEESKLKIMVDKDCQTSSWMIYSLVGKKPSKLKKKALSFSVKKRRKERRESSASDTFIQADLKKKHKKTNLRSSLGDLRVDRPGKQGFTRKLEHSSSLSPKSVRTSHKSTLKRERSAKLERDHTAQDSLKSRSSDKQDFKKKNLSLKNSKKLTLPAVAIIRNRLAKLRGKRQPSPSSSEDEDGPGIRPGTDDFVNFENELNLSKIEDSKETDLVDEVVFEPEFSLDYSKKQIRFESPYYGEASLSDKPVATLTVPATYRLRHRRESTLRQRKRKCVQYCKKVVAFLFSHVGLCSLVVAYTIMGGFIFQALESNAETTVRRTIRDERERVVGRLMSLAAEFKRTETGLRNLTLEVNDTVLGYQKFIHGVTKDRGWDGTEGADEEGPWTFASSLLFAISVMTTIGYGHVAPKTPEGRIVTIGYAVVGIPLTLLCLTNIGDVMATGFRLLYGKVCCGVCCTMFKFRPRGPQIDLEKGLGSSVVTREEEEADKTKEIVHVPTSLCLLLIASYILAGALLFSEWEGWDILTGSYFCFITLSTIGFGDIVPGMDSKSWAAEEKLVLCALYLILGLSLIAMCFNLVQEDVKAKCRWLGMKLGIVEKHQTPI